MSQPKPPDAKARLLALIAEDAETYEQMKAAGHRELCLAYQDLVPQIVDALVSGRPLGDELTEARAYLTECDLCAESVRAATRALPELQDYETGPETDHPPAPPDAPGETPEKKAPGRLGRWWQRRQRLITRIIVITCVVLVCVALVGIGLQALRQCGTVRHDPAPPTDASSPTSPAITVPDAAPMGMDRQYPPGDPRRRLLDQGQLAFVSTTLGMIKKRQGLVSAQLGKTSAALEALVRSQDRRPAVLGPIDREIASMRLQLARARDALERVDAYLKQVSTKAAMAQAPLGQQLSQAKGQLAALRATQRDLARQLGALYRTLRKLSARK